MNELIKLGVNIDHVATVRQARGTRYPDPAEAALAAQIAGADGITLHLREDKRHIQPFDVAAIAQKVSVPINLEMAATPEMLKFALAARPEKVCLVPEKRAELTTEGGLDVISYFDAIKDIVAALKEVGIEVSLFIDPNVEQIDASISAGVNVIELHTGAYAEVRNIQRSQLELVKIQDTAKYAARKGLIVNAGHGLYYDNVQAIARIPEMNELNIGHGIVAQALFTGFGQAVMDMKVLMLDARKQESYSA